MKILACDTSNRACSCCLYEDGRVVDAKFLNNGLTHSQTFMPMVHDLMQENGEDYRGLDALACTVGPGSFTGIRIGVSAVKTMAMAAVKPAIPVSSLEALAEPLKEEDALIVPMIDCRNKRAWAAAYYHGEQVISEMADDVSAIVGKCEKYRSEKLSGKKILVIGNGGKMYLQEEGVCRETVLFKEGYEEIRSENVAAIAARMVEKELTVMGEKNVPEKSRTGALMIRFSPRALMPVYRAKTQAERVADEQGKKVEDVPIRYYSTLDDEK